MHDHNRLKFDKNGDVSDGERMFHNYVHFKLRRLLKRRRHAEVTVSSFLRNLEVVLPWYT